VAQPLSSLEDDRYTSWHSPAWVGAKALVLGLGQTGFAVVDTLAELGASVLALAPQAESDVVTIAGVVGASVVIESDESTRISAAQEFGADFAVVSPGVDIHDPIVESIRAQGVPVWSDLDFAWRVRDKNPSPASWIVVIGSQSSAQIAGLATRILVAEGHRVRHVGFDAPPLLDALREPEPYDMLLISASDTSVLWWQRYPEALRRPLVSVSLEAGDGATEGTRFDGTTLACVYRRGVGQTEALVQDADVVEGARAIGIGMDSPGMSDVGIVEGIVCDRAFLDERAHQALEISTLEELAEAGWSIPEDVPMILAAIAIARAVDVPPAVIAGVLSLP
jgi:UDP-N-acetylmuramoylalanine--D-glutamate ligase